MKVLGENLDEPSVRLSLYGWDGDLHNVDTVVTDCNGFLAGIWFYMNGDLHSAIRLCAISPFKHFDSHACCSRLHKVKFLRRSEGKIDDSPFMKRTAIIHPDDNSLSVLRIGDANFCAEWERPMGCSEIIHIIDLTVGRLFSVKLVGVV